MTEKNKALLELMRIPGVGRQTAQDLLNLGFHSVEELKGMDPEKMYNDLCRFQGCKLDRCILYVFKCAVYYASNTTHDPELLKWWNWKDKNLTNSYLNQKDCGI
ncbi:MAG: helix-hairpin-helix domain-containing protein [Clostridia bacterium]|nr:helix-hairpin-helix domain-containing protein [Clostridia bacterium]